MISEIDLVTEEQKRCPIREIQVNNQDSSYSINNNNNMREELELSLGRTSCSRESKECHGTKLTFHKIFTCNFCMRKFYNAQALGGHQNAHKRERGRPRRYRSQNVMSSMMMSLPYTHTNPRTLGASTHSMVFRNPDILQGNNVEAKQHSTTTTDRNMMWPGIFHVEHHHHPKQVVFSDGQSSSSKDVRPLNLNLSL